jgi:hypothetical protein
MGIGYTQSTAFFTRGHGRNTWRGFDWNIFYIVLTFTFLIPFLVALPSIQDPSSPFNPIGCTPRDGLESMAEL